MSIESLSSLVYSVLLILSLWGVGTFTLKTFSFRFNRTIDQSLYGIGVGYVVITNILFILGLFNLINKWSASVVLIFSLLLSFYQIYLFIIKLRPFTLRFNYSNYYESLIIGFLLIFFFMNLIGSLSPPTLGDSMNHHLSAPKYYGKIGGFPFVPIVPWPAPGLMHVLYTQGIILSNGIACQILSCLFGLLVTLSIFSFTYNFLGLFFGLITSAIFYSLPLIVDLSTGGMVELGAFYCTTLSIFALIQSFPKFDIKWIILGGLLGGCAGATKLWSLTVGPASVFAIIYVFKDRLLKNSWSIIKVIMIYSAMFNILLIPWFLRNFIASGNPIWPLASTIFDTLYISDIWAMKYSLWERGPGTSILDFFMGPWNLTNRIDLFNAGYGIFTSYLLNPVFLMFSPIAMFYKNSINKNLKIVVKFFVVFCLITYIFWFFGGYHHPRYLGGIYPFISILSGIGIKITTDQLKNNYRKIIFIILTALLIFFLAIAFFINQKYFGVVFGNINEESYLENNLNNYEGVRWLNQNLPENSKVLYAGTSAWYYMKNDYTPLSFKLIDYSNIKTPQELYEKLKEINITHVYIESDDSENALLSKWREDELGDFKLNSIKLCQEWLNLGAEGTGIYITTYYEARPFVLMRGLELLGDLPLLALVKTKKIKSRTKRESVASEAAVYQLK